MCDDWIKTEVYVIMTLILIMVATALETIDDTSVQIIEIWNAWVPIELSNRIFLEYLKNVRIT